MPTLLLALALAAAGGYDPDAATQFQWPSEPDLVPQDAPSRRMVAKALAFDATLYGMASIIQYRQMHAQAIDPAAPGYTGFNRLAHERRLAGPDFKPFQSPNADTLYSNAWLDLRNGPVLFETPDTGERYFTANFLDAYANATNISTRTHGNRAGRYLIATTDWQGTVPQGAQLFRVTTPFMWVLLRVVVENARDLRAANALQDRFTLTPLAPAPALVRFPAAPADDDALGFFRALDFVLRENGHPRGEDALVRRYAAIGVGSGAPFDVAAADPAVVEGLRSGYAEARLVVTASLQQRSAKAGPWSFGRDVGRYGYNYLQRAVTNLLGAGANVRDENAATLTFRDAAGEPLSGANGCYRLRLKPLPPARYFWSVTLYDAKTRQLHPNTLQRYQLGDRTAGLAFDADGGVTIQVAARRPEAGTAANWLPAPDGPFYLAVRVQGPSEDAIEGRWRPQPVEKGCPR